MRIFWCEQSGIIEDRSQLVAALESSGIEYRRLNWKRGLDDKFANVKCSEDRLSWSKGRELLFNSVKNEMAKGDYIVLADDDIEIVNRPDSLEHLRTILARFRPPLAVPYSTNRHHLSTGMEYHRLRDPEKPFPIFLADLQVQIFRRDFADMIFPSIYDGGYGTYWYAYFFCALKYGYGALCIPHFMVKNLRHESVSGDYGGVTNNMSDEIWRASEQILPTRVKKWFSETKNRGVTVRVANSWYASRPFWMMFGSLFAERKFFEFRECMKLGTWKG
ncbi:MAG: hypothetical protein V7720_04530 [Halioglobus sp.]